MIVGAPGNPGALFCLFLYAKCRVKIFNCMIETLKNRLDLLDTLQETQKKKVESLKDGIKLTSGAYSASSEISKSFDEFCAKKQQELSTSVKKGVINLEVANFGLSMLNQVKLFLKENVLNYDRVNHMRQGEIIAHNSQLNDVIKMINETQKNLEQEAENRRQQQLQQQMLLQQQQLEAQRLAEEQRRAELYRQQQQLEEQRLAEEKRVAEENFLAAQKLEKERIEMAQASNIRPDKRDTKLGRAARDIMNRRKNAYQESEKLIPADVSKKRKGRPKLDR